MHPQACIDHILHARPHATASHRVIDGVGVIADELLDLRIAARLCRILQLPPLETSQRRLPENFTHAAYAAHQALHIVGLGKEGRVYERHGSGIGRGQLHAAPTPWLQQTDMAGVTVAQHRLATVIDQLAHHKMQLQIGRTLLRPAADKAAGLGKVAGQHAPALTAPAAHALPDIPEAGKRQAKAVHHLRAVHHLHHIGVVMQMLAHTGEVMHDINACLLQMLARPYAREHQQLRRLQRPGTKQDLAPAA